jgi:hypothetical protein
LTRTDQKIALEIVTVTNNNSCTFIYFPWFQPMVGDLWIRF